MSRRSGLALAAAVLGGLVWARVWGVCRDVTLEPWHGVLGLMNIAAITGHGGDRMLYTPSRPPAGVAIATPFLASRSGEPRRALAAVRVLMPGVFAVVVAVSFLFFSRLFSLPAAFAAGGLLALDPLALSQAPFFLFDIGAGLPALLFLWAAWRQMESPTAGRRAMTAAAAALAATSRYHLPVLFLAPMAQVLIRGRGGPRERLIELVRSGLWLTPLWGALGFGVLQSGLEWLAHGSPPVLRDLQMVWLELRANLGDVNPARPWWLYADGLWAQLGSRLSWLGLTGVGVWCARRRPRDSYLALALLLPLAAMSGVVRNRDHRYALFLLPLVYAAVGEGIEAVTTWLKAGRALRWSIAAACLGMGPIGATMASWRYIKEEPVLRSRAFLDLAGWLEGRVPPDGCVGWRAGDIAMPLERGPGGPGRPDFLMGAPVFRYFVARRLEELRSGAVASCAPAVIVEPGTDGGGALATIWADGRPERRLYPDGLRPAAP